VRCPDCAAEVSPLREFCPECGAPTDPGMRQRLRAGKFGARPPEELKRNRKVVLGAAAGLVILAGVMGRGLFSGNIPHDVVKIEHQDEVKGPVVVSAVDLANAYRTNRDAAAERFGDDRELTVTGEFQRIVPDGYGSLDLRLKTSDPEQPLGVDVAGVAIDDAKKLVPGQQVTVSCRGMGEGTDILWVRDCAVQSAAATTASGPPAPPAPPVPGSAPPNSPPPNSPPSAG
jgi:hypothetical protein